MAASAQFRQRNGQKRSLFPSFDEAAKVAVNSYTNTHRAVANFEAVQEKLTFSTVKTQRQGIEASYIVCDQTGHTVLAYTQIPSGRVSFSKRPKQERTKLATAGDGRLFHGGHLLPYSIVGGFHCAESIEVNGQEVDRQNILIYPSIAQITCPANPWDQYEKRVMNARRNSKSVSIAVAPQYLLYEKPILQGSRRPILSAPVFLSTFYSIDNSLPIHFTLVNTFSQYSVPRQICSLMSDKCQGPKAKVLSHAYKYSQLPTYKKQAVQSLLTNISYNMQTRQRRTSNDARLNEFIVKHPFLYQHLYTRNGSFQSGHVSGVRAAMQRPERTGDFFADNALHVTQAHTMDGSGKLYPFENYIGNLTDRIVREINKLQIA